MYQYSLAPIAIYPLDPQYDKTYTIRIAFVHGNHYVALMKSPARALAVTQLNTQEERLLRASYTKRLTEEQSALIIEICSDPSESEDVLVEYIENKKLEGGIIKASDMTHLPIHVFKSYWLKRSNNGATKKAQESLS